MYDSASIKENCLFKIVYISCLFYAEDDRDWRDTDRVRRCIPIKLRLLTFHENSPLHTQLSNSFTRACLTLFSYSPELPSQDSSFLPCFAALHKSKANCASMAPEAHSINTTTKPRGALRSSFPLGHIHWHKPLFALAHHVKAASLMSASLRLSDSAPLGSESVKCISF